MDANADYLPSLPKPTPAEVQHHLSVALGELQRAKPNDRSAADRHWAIAINLMEQVFSYFSFWVVDQQLDHTTSVDAVAQAGYAAFVEQSVEANPNGAPYPEWGAMDEPMRRCWRVAAIAMMGAS